MEEIGRNGYSFSPRTVLPIIFLQDKRTGENTLLVVTSFVKQTRVKLCRKKIREICAPILGAANYRWKSITNDNAETLVGIFAMRLLVSPKAPRAFGNRSRHRCVSPCARNSLGNEIAPGNRKFGRSWLVPISTITTIAPPPLARTHKPGRRHPLPLTFSATDDYEAELSSLVTTSSKV